MRLLLCVRVACMLLCLCKSLRACVDAIQIVIVATPNLADTTGIDSWVNALSLLRLLRLLRLVSLSKVGGTEGLTGVQTVTRTNEHTGRHANRKA